MPACRTRHAALLGAVAVAACRAPAASSPTAPPASASGRVASVTLPARAAGPARWFPIGDASDARYRADDPDGRTRIVERGLRYVLHDDGRIERAADLLPSGTLAVLELPARLGRGWLFRLTQDNATDLFRAKEFTSRLEPLVRLPFEVADLTAGFDRLYATSARTRAVVGLDPRTGASLGAGPIPAAPAYGTMAFAGDWLSAVEVDLRGVLVSFDAGASYHPVGLPVAPPGIVMQGGRIVLSTTRGAYALAASGELERVDGTSPEAAFGGAVAGEDEETALPGRGGAKLGPFALLGGPPLELAVLRGVLDSVSSAVVAAGGTVARVSLSDGRILASEPHVLPSGSVCQGVPLGSGLGFVCGADRGPTTVYALGEGLAVTPVLEFAGPRQVSPSGNGALVVEGACTDGATAGDTYCVRDRAGVTRDLNVQGDVGVERVVALADGRITVVAPPRLGLAGTLTVIGPGDAIATRALDLRAMPEDTRNLISRALWLKGMAEVAPGILGAWAVGSSAFVGLRVDLSGKVTAGTQRTGIEHTNLSGRFALALGEQGDARETTDFGATWTDVTLPAADLVTNPGPSERGCTQVGCALGSFVRVGWGDDKTFTEAKPPPPLRVEASPFVSWALQCSMEGAALPARPSAARVRIHRTESAGTRTSVVASLSSSAWRPFLGVPAPERGDDLGFDFGTEDQTVQLRGYVWGPGGSAWDRAGTWLVRGVDRFRARDDVWSTAPSRPPFSDAQAASETFGSDPTSRISSEWSSVLDPSGDAGLLFMRSGTRLDLAVVERDRAIVAVQNASEFMLEKPAGAVNAHGRWFLGSVPGPRAFQLLSIEGGTMATVASYPRFGEDSFARVVRTTRGDAVGVWTVQRGAQGTRSGGDTWYVYPVDPASGALEQPDVVPHGELDHAPRPCGADAEGWILPYDVSPSIGKIDFVRVSETPALERIEARLVANRDGVCLDAVAAQVNGDPPRDLRATGPAQRSAAASLVLTDRATDRRWEFRCSPR